MTTRATTARPLPMTVDLRGRILTAADLEGIDLAGADLRGATLDGLDLTRQHFTGCDLRGASLRGCCLDWARFTGADLRGADLADSHGERVALADAVLCGANVPPWVLGL